jgi:hypothetical protein
MYRQDEGKRPKGPEGETDQDQKYKMKNHSDLVSHKNAEGERSATKGKLQNLKALKTTIRASSFSSSFE